MWFLLMAFQRSRVFDFDPKKKAASKAFGGCHSLHHPQISNDLWLMQANPSLEISYEDLLCIMKSR
jgi:hypothetical protein